MICLFLARRGHRVGYLGANLPAEESARVVQPRPELAYGGWVFNAHPKLRARTPGIYLGADARAAAAQVEQLLSGSHAARLAE